MGKLIGVIVALVIALILGFASFFTVDVGERAFVVRFGEITSETYTEGMHRKNPFLDEVVTMSIKDKRIDRTVTAASKDLQNVTAEMNLNYSISSASVTSLYSTVGSERAIEDVLIAPSIQETVKSATAKFTAEELVTKRSEVRNLIIENLNEKLADRWLLVNDVNIINFAFSPEFDKSIEAKVKAEQDALTSKNELEKVKYQAQQDIERSRAEAEKIRIQAESISKQGGSEYVELKKIEVLAKFADKRQGTVPNMITSDSAAMLLNMAGFNQ